MRTRLLEKIPQRVRTTNLVRLTLVKDKEASQDPTAGESYAACKKPSAYENQAAADEQVAGEELAWGSLWGSISW